MMRIVSGICLVIAALILTACNSPLSLTTTGTSAAAVKALVSYSSLKAKVNGLYVSANNSSSPLVADSATVAEGQAFAVVSNADGSVSFQSKSTSLYVTVDSTQANKLIAKSAAIGTAEKFTTVTQADGTVALLAQANNLYVSAEMGLGAVLYASKGAASTWEFFTISGGIEPSPTPSVAPSIAPSAGPGSLVYLKAEANNLFVTASTNSSLIANSNNAADPQAFTMTSNVDGTVSLWSKGTGLYVSVLNTDNTLLANSAGIGVNEKFTKTNQADGSIALRSLVNNYFVCADMGQNGVLYANRAAASGWESFVVITQLPTVAPSLEPSVAPSLAPSPTPISGKSLKRGIAYDLSTAADFAALKNGVSWWYNWGVGAHGPANAAASYGMDYAPMSWNGNNLAAGGEIDRYLAAHPECKYLLLINEPNLADQANQTISQTVNLWPLAEALSSKYQVKLVGPALNWGTVNTADNPANPISWLDGFFAQYRSKYAKEPQVDAIAFHWYDYGLIGSNTGFLDDPTKLPKYGKKIWVTEFANWHSGNDGAQIDSAAKQKAQMAAWVSWMETHDLVERYSWFTGRQSGNPCFISLFQNYGQSPSQGDGVLSELGQYYINLPVGR